MYSKDWEMKKEKDEVKMNGEFFQNESGPEKRNKRGFSCNHFQSNKLDAIL